MVPDNTVHLIHRAVGEWEYPAVVESMEAAGFHPIGVYISRLQATIV